MTLTGMIYWLKFWQFQHLMGFSSRLCQLESGWGHYTFGKTPHETRNEFVEYASTDLLTGQCGCMPPYIFFIPEDRG